MRAVPYDEVRDDARAVRPDYAIGVDGAITGYVEIKRPGISVDPSTFTGHNRTQWERQRDLPNLIYTNGTEWWLWRDSEPISGPIYLSGGPLDRAGSELTAPPELELLLTDFLRWRPAPITSVGALVQAIAPLTRLLRGEVLDELANEGRRTDGRQRPFTGLARDWRALLFPTASDDVFAHGYAQAERTEGAALDAMTEMPSTLTYDASARRLALGSATWGPVRPDVFDYTVGGKNALRSWFNYRNAMPGGKKTSPLDHMHVDSCPEAWSTELTELLSLLTRLAEHEPAQAALLDRAMAGPLLTVPTLAGHGVRWPTTAKDRKPRYDLPPAPDQPGRGTTVALTRRECAEMVVRGRREEPSRHTHWTVVRSRQSASAGGRA